MSAKPETKMGDAIAECRRRNRILELLKLERQRQNSLLAQGKIDFNCACPDIADGHKLAVLTEEVGEVAKAILEQNDEIEQQDIRTELIQVAAVAVAWLESLEDR